MKFIKIKECKTCPNRHLDIKYFSCHMNRQPGWYCSVVNQQIVSINEEDINPCLTQLLDDFIPDWCPLEEYVIMCWPIL